MKLLKAKEKELHKLAEELCDKETLDYKEVLEIVEQKK
jgi:ATP-dependent Zn protease